MPGSDRKVGGGYRDFIREWFGDQSCLIFLLVTLAQKVGRVNEIAFCY